MKILALESSGLVASVALWADGCLMGEYTTNFKKTHSQTLLPMLDGLMTMLFLQGRAHLPGFVLEAPLPKGSAWR